MNCIQQLMMKVYFTRSFIFLRAVAGFHAAQSDSASRFHRSCFKASSTGALSVTPFSLF